MQMDVTMKNLSGVCLAPGGRGGEKKKKCCQKIYFPFIGGAVLRQTAGKEADVKACLSCLRDAASIDRTLQDGAQEEGGEEEEIEQVGGNSSDINVLQPKKTGAHTVFTTWVTFPPKKKKK